MKCKNCPALRSNCGYEQNADDWWCAVGEESFEFKNGEIGCFRKSTNKLEKDIKQADKCELEAFNSWVDICLKAELVDE